MTRQYYEHACCTEGRDVPELPPCKLLFWKRQADELTLVPATEVRLWHASIHASHQ